MVLHAHDKLQTSFCLTLKEHEAGYVELLTSDSKAGF
jgi:hypothetical protein